MGDQTDQTDPTRQYDQPEHTDEQQPHPGLTQTMRDKPDHGEDTYRGSSRLTGKRAVITGADSGIGRAVALAFAREGAEVVVLTADHTHYGEREVETLSQPVRRPLRAVTR